MIQRQIWTDHKFNLGIDPGWAINILSRLKSTEILLEHHAKGLAEETLSKQEKGKWSIKEHIGHLTDLEALWMNRFQQIDDGNKELVAADMSNSKTGAANHNACSVNELLLEFRKERKKLILQFQSLSEATLRRQAHHPRIKMMMRPVDLLFFIAEHDDHHLSSILEIKALNND